MYGRSEVIFDAESLANRLTTLEERMGVPTFWDNGESAQEVIREVKTLRGWLDPYRAIESKLRDLEEFGALLEEEADESLQAEWSRELGALELAIERLELRNMLRGKDDERDALLTIHPGAGGTESQDWAEMLMRMYSRWAESHGFAVAVLDLLPGEEAGIKSVTLEVKGQYAYGYLKAEKGVHRLVRISPFDSQARRHTSFASVFVYPDIEDDIQIDIDENELRIDTFRASGAGGQHVNKTSSAVRITHLPTGIAVACQQERSQHKNKATAMKMLKAALYEREEQKRQEERDKVESTKTDIAWGNQIRSYVFQPYTMVNDHRTDLKLSDVQSVMNGDLDPFIEAYLKEFGGRAA